MLISPSPPTQCFFHGLHNQDKFENFMIANYRQMIFINYYDNTDETVLIPQVGTETGGSLVLVENQLSLTKEFD